MSAKEVRFSTDARDRMLKGINTGFLEGRNAFKVAAKAQKPVKLSEMESLFMSGELSDVISFTFEGKNWSY